MKTSFSMILFAGFAGLGYAVYGAVDQALNVDVLPNKEEAGKDLGILTLPRRLVRRPVQSLPVLWSASRATTWSSRLRLPLPFWPASSFK
jgi:hypothetical protein